MTDLIAEPWAGYELLDSGSGRRLERFGTVTVTRPDAACIWLPSHPDHAAWQRPDLAYDGKAGAGAWRARRPELFDGWTVEWEDVSLLAVPTPFRHLSLFPEQSAHWEWLRERISANVRRGMKPRVLNLFAYTGAASLVAAKAGAEVCHVDASKASVYRAKDNAARSGLPDDAIRWIVEDAVKFMRREARRGKRYDAIVMDPPVFGRGSQGEVWRLESGLAELASLSRRLLEGPDAAFLLNFYATALYPDAVRRLVEGELDRELGAGALHLRESLSGKRLQTGYFLRS